MNSRKFVNKLMDSMKKEGISDKDTLQRIRIALEEFSEDKIFDIWCVEDIIDYAKNTCREISKEKAQEILLNIDRHFDASIGINWDVISEFIE